MCVSGLGRNLRKNRISATAHDFVENARDGVGRSSGMTFVTKSKDRRRYINFCSVNSEKSGIESFQVNASVSTISYMSCQIGFELILRERFTGF